jgi:hypothetical protein
VQQAIARNQYAEGGANYAAAQALMQQITGNVSNFQGQILQGAQTASQDYQNAQNNIIAQMNQGLITIPTSYTPRINPLTGQANIGTGTPQYISSTPTNSFVQSNYGPYGRKPLY